MTEEGKPTRRLGPVIGRMIVVLLAVAAFIAAGMGPRIGIDKRVLLAIIAFLGACGYALCKARWWALLLFVPVLLLGGCTSLFM